MPKLALRQYQAVASMAQLLSEFLPGSGNRTWKGHVSFQSITEKLGLSTFWIGGSVTFLDKCPKIFLDKCQVFILIKCQSRNCRRCHIFVKREGVECA
jgi:hypothetical protein